MCSKISYVSCERCSKPLLRWQGKIMVDKQQYGYKIPYLKTFCVECTRHIDNVENGREKYHMLVELFDYTYDEIFSEDNFEDLGQEAKETHELIDTKAKQLSNFQKKWAKNRKKREYSTIKKELNQEDKHFILLGLGRITYKNFMRILFELYDKSKELPIVVFNLDNPNSKQYELEKENFENKKKESFLEPIQYFLSIQSEYLDNKDELFSFIQEIFESVLENRMEVEEALIWIKLEIVYYFYQTKGIILDNDSFGDK